jgi:hypothetical protein
MKARNRTLAILFVAFVARWVAAGSSSNTGTAGTTGRPAAPE